MADFSVTSCTFSRSIVAPEDTIDITMTIKNTAGAELPENISPLPSSNQLASISG